MSSSSLAECLACLNSTLVMGSSSSGKLSSENIGAIVSVVVGVLLAVYQALLKFPRVQRFIGAENTAKREQLNAIAANTESIAKASRPENNK
jgi:hypothetical protein